MAVSRKSKKKNTRIFIAIAIAGILALLLFVILSKQGSKVSQVLQDRQTLEAQINTLKQQIEEQKRADRLAMRTQQTAQPEKEVVKNTLTVVVAKTPIEAGTRLGYELMETKEWPQEAVPVNAANYPESLLGRIVSSDVASGEPILPTKLIDKDTQTLEIPEGFRAMTIPVDGITGVGGFLMPGSRVDLLTVVPKSIDSSNSQEKLSKILIQNVKVLATSGGGGSTARGAKPKDSSSTITIAVPAAEATKIALAYDNGSGNIQVILRSFQDNTEVDKTAIDTGEFITGNMAMGNQDIVIPDIDLPKPPTSDNYSAGANMDLNSILNDTDGLPPPTPPTAQTKTHSIEIIQANSRQEVSFETEI
jgi:pilus assembly protein CpaB